MILECVYNTQKKNTTTFVSVIKYCIFIYSFANAGRGRNQRWNVFVISILLSSHKSVRLCQFCWSVLLWGVATNLCSVSESALQWWIRGVICVYCLHRPDQHFAIEAAAANNISDVRHVFDSLDWSEQSYRMFERIGQTEELIHVCSLNTEEVSYELPTLMLGIVSSIFINTFF